jgi:hypothetical protein
MKPSNLFPLAALAGLLTLALSRWQRTHWRRLAEKPEPLPEPLQVWEDEGGQNQMAEPPRTAEQPR